MLKSAQRARSQNRRVSSTRQRRRQHLMEVKVRRETARRQQSQQVFGILFRLCFFILLLGGAYYGVREVLVRYFFDNPEYRLAEVEVVISGDMTRSELLEVAKVEEGVNIFSVNLGNVSRAIQELPQVEEVEVERILPNKIAIRVEERRPVAWLAPLGEGVDPFTDARSMMLDPRGYSMPVRHSRTEYLSFPVIWARPEALDIGLGTRVVNEGILAGLDLLQKVQTAPLGARFVIQDIDLSKEFCLVVRDKSKMQVMFGLENLDRQIDKLGAMLDHFDPLPNKPATINLLVERNTPVTFVQNTVVETPEEPVPEPAKKGKKETPVRKATPVNPNKGKKSSHG